MRRPEILAPAGSIKAMEAAIKAGADAVYMGGARFGARAYADNPEKDELIDAIHYVHLYGKKIYLTLNTLIKEEELDLIGDFLLPYYKAGLDGIIIQDLGVFSYVENNFPGLALHASTQMNITDAASARLLKEAGACRVVPARELSFDEIRTIKDETGLEIETFVHGALCYCYSGRCLMSSVIGGRSGNRGRCAQPCRLPYEVAGNLNGSYILSPKDLCAVSLIPKLIEAGVDSFKIEGRMKSPEYVATIVSIYRKYVDTYLEHPKSKFKVSQEDWNHLLEAYNRGGFTDGYFEKHNGQDMMSMERPNHQGMKVGKIEKIKDGKIYFHPDISIHKGDGFEILIPGEKENVTLTSPADCKKGENFSLNARKLSDLRQGFSILRTGNSWMKQQLSENLLDLEKKIPVYGYAQFKAFKPSLLVLSLEDTRSFQIEGDIVQKAKGNPTTEEQIRKPLMQTGASRFDFKDLVIDLDEEAFFPVGAVKKLRRQGLEGLEYMLMTADDRSLPEDIRNWKRMEYGSQCTSKYTFDIPAPRIRVSFEDREKVWDLMEMDKVDDIYLPLEEFSSEERSRLMDMALVRGKRIYYSFPYVFRKNVKKYYDEIWQQILKEKPAGFLIRNIDEFAWIREKMRVLKSDSNNPVFEIILDSSLYAYNKEAIWMYQSLMGQCVTQTYPLELNRKELDQIDLKKGELLVYGRLPLMVSAQCVTRNTNGCVKQTGYLTMKDRYDKKFYARRHCIHCYNTIWNGTPLSLHGTKEELNGFEISSVRLHFTLEKKDEMRRLIQTFYEEWNNLSISNPMIGDFTRGHYKRGVE